MSTLISLLGGKGTHEYLKNAETPLAGALFTKL